MIQLSENLDPKYILRLLQTKKEKIQFGEYLVKTGSKRYQVFRRSFSCAGTCGRRIHHARLECYEVDAGKSIGHFNFYSADDVLMTKDHIFPVSKGGKNHISNLQTMCKKCNERKSNG